MERHYHVITCPSVNDMESFIRHGKVGVGPVVSSAISNAVRMQWDILADMARVKPTDYVFLHAKGFTNGVFEVTHDPVLDTSLARFFDGPDLTTRIWKKNWNLIQRLRVQPKSPWWIPIRPVEGLCFAGMHMHVLFDAIARGQITSLPQRLRYEDKNKTIKGITPTDFEKILLLFENYSTHQHIPNPRSSTTTGTRPIDFDFLAADRYEKNLETILVHRIRLGKLKIGGYQAPSPVLVLNTVPLGYLKMADLVTWMHIGCSAVNPWVWELKRQTITGFHELRDEIQKLNGRASHVGNLLGHGYKTTGVLLAQSFSQDALEDFGKVILPVGHLEELMLISYGGSGAKTTFDLVSRRM